MKIILTCFLLLAVLECSFEKMGASAGKGIADETDSFGNSPVK